MPQSYRSLIYLWSAVFSISAVGAATLHAFGPVGPQAPAPEKVAAPASAPIQPIAAAAPRLAGAEESAHAPPVIELASPSPAVLAAGITDMRKLPLPPEVPAVVPSQPVIASVAPSQPAQALRAKAPAPARRPAPPMEAAFAPSSPAQSAPPLPAYNAYRPPAQSFASHAPTSYIGVYTRGPDGMRVFQSYP